MTRLDPDRMIALVAGAALQDAWLQGSRGFWLRRAEQLEAARPRRGDYTGQATAEDLAACWDRLTAKAQACRARATGADCWAQTTLAETASALIDPGAAA
jgi:hypothetical protein